MLSRNSSQCLGIIMAARNSACCWSIPVPEDTWRAPCYSAHRLWGAEVTVVRCDAQLCLQLMQSGSRALHVNARFGDSTIHPLERSTKQSRPRPMPWYDSYLLDYQGDKSRAIAHATSSGERMRVNVTGKEERNVVVIISEHSP